LWFEQAKKALEDGGLVLLQAESHSDAAVIDRACKAAIEEGVRTVIVGGGDGTLSLVARHFVTGSSALGLLPLGTGNAFARDLGIPADVDTACKVILRGRSAWVDLGHANDDYFVNVATVGLTTRIARELTDEAKKRFGRAVYLYAMSRALARVRPFTARITTPEGHWEFDTLQVVIGNGRYHAGPFPIAPDASITEGKLSIYGLATTSRASFLKLAWHLRTGKHVELPEVHWISTAEGSLETVPVRNVTVDGQIVFKTPLQFSVAPKALEVYVPDSFKG
jgi:diacylglycerol kinase (ATP)